MRLYSRSDSVDWGGVRPRYLRPPIIPDKGDRLPADGRSRRIAPAATAGARLHFRDAANRVWGEEGAVKRRARRRTTPPGGPPPASGRFAGEGGSLFYTPPE